jgi:hypothetical protein
MMVRRIGNRGSLSSFKLPSGWHFGLVQLGLARGVFDEKPASVAAVPEMSARLIVVDMIALPCLRSNLQSGDLGGGKLT